MLFKKLNTTVFLSTFAILMVIFGIYLTLTSLLLPYNYEKYIEHQIEEFSDTIITQIKIGEYDEAMDLVRKSVSHNNFLIEIRRKEDNEVVYPDEAEVELYERVFDISTAEFYHTDPLDFEIDGLDYYMNIYVSLEAINVSRRALISIAPVLVFIFSLIAILLSLVYSRLLVQPVRKLHKKSQQIAELNFDNNIVIDRRDEIGELSLQLDVMSDRLKKTIDHLEDDVSRAENLERERRNYMSMISHELKTPLTKVRGLSECMLTNVGPYKDRDKYLAETIEVIDEMYELVNTILASSQLDNFNNIVNPEQLDLREFVIDYLNNNEFLYEERDISICNNLTDLVVDVDYTLFTRALGNVLENAIKYCDPGGKVVISNTENSISVSNSYDKVENLDFALLVKPFERSESSRSTTTGGHGLGLYIVSKTCNLHNFKLDVYGENLETVVKITFN